LGARPLLWLRHDRYRRPQLNQYQPSTSETYVEWHADRNPGADRGGGPKRIHARGNPGNGSDWPEHADAELKWLYSENKIPVRYLRANRSLLSLFTKKLNGRLQKKQPYTIKEVSDRLNALESRLSPLDKTSVARTEASSLEE
jgi:hypothetical protein